MPLVSNKQTTLPANARLGNVDYVGEVHIQCAQFDTPKGVRDVALWRFTHGGLTHSQELTIGLWDADTCQTYEQVLEHMRARGVTLIDENKPT